MNGVAGADRWAGRVLAVTSAVLLAGSLRPTRRVRTTAAPVSYTHLTLPTKA